MLSTLLIGIKKGEEKEGGPLCADVTSSAVCKDDSEEEEIE